MRSGSPTILTANYQILHEGLKKKKKHYLLLPTSNFFFKNVFILVCDRLCFFQKLPELCFCIDKLFVHVLIEFFFTFLKKKEDIFYIIKNNQVVELMKRSNTYKWIWAQEIFKQDYYTLLHFVKRKRNTFHIVYIIPTLSLEENLL